MRPENKQAYAQHTEMGAILSPVPFHPLALCSAPGVLDQLTGYPSHSSSIPQNVFIF